jgi:fatty-acyl-CoA synthase
MEELLRDSHYTIRDQEQILDTTVSGVLRHAAQSVPDMPALIEVDQAGKLGRRWTYFELHADAENLARALSTHFAPGEKICIWAPNLPEWVLLEYACAFAGLTLVTANPAFQAQELRYVLEQSGSVALFMVESFRGNPMAEIAKTATDDLPNLRCVVDISNPQQIYARGDRSEQLPEVTADEPAQIQYTSGTTGFPKGAVLSHRGLTNNARFYAQRLDAKRGEPWMNTMPLFHTAGCAMQVLGAAQTPSPLYLFALFDPVAVLRLIEQERLVLGGGVPTMLVAMLEVLETQSFDLSSLRTVISGGSTVPPQLVRAVADKIGCSIQTVYGQTECSPLLTMHGLSETIEDACNTVGPPMMQTELAILDTDTGAVLPLGKQGEICARGYFRMIEYNDNPQATADTIDAQGWLHTGDLGTMDARGYVAVTGRAKEMIIRGGENLFPVEIENCLLDHDSVAEVAVVGIPDDKWGEVVAAFVRPNAGATVEPGVLKNHCRAHLAAIKTPEIWCQMEAFPLTGSGKIRKFALRNDFVAGQVSAIAGCARDASFSGA